MRWEDVLMTWANAVFVVQAVLKPTSTHPRAIVLWLDDPSAVYGVRLAGKMSRLEHGRHGTLLDLGYRVLQLAPR